MRRILERSVVIVVAVLFATIVFGGSARAADVTGTITPGGSPVSVTLTSPGDVARLTFAGTVGQRVSLKIDNVSISSSGIAALQAGLLKPDGSWLAYTGYVFNSGSGFIDTMTLPTSGTYTVMVFQYQQTIGSSTVTLYDVASDVTGSISPGGSAVAVSTSVPGRNGQLTFSGTVGQRVFLKALTSGLASAGTAAAVVTILKPDGSSLGSTGWVFSSGPEFVDTKTLPTNGTYTVLVDFYQDTTGTTTVTLYDVPADGTGSIVLGGVAVSVANSTAGQNGQLTFAGAAGQRVFLKALTSGLTAAGSAGVVVTILKPDGSSLGSTGYVGNNGKGFVDTKTLPTSGTYTVLIDPYEDTTGTASVTLYDVAPDLGTPVAIDGPAARVSLGVGQGAALPFTGAAGQTIRFDRSAITIGVAWHYKIVKADGSTVVSSGIVSNIDGTLNADLPSTGQYSLLIDPAEDYAGSATLGLAIRGDAPYAGADVSSCGTTPVFRAQPVAGATQYQFQVASDAGFASIVSDSGLQPANTFTPAAGALASGGSYYWRWKTGTGSWSSGRNFSTNLPKLGARDSAATWSLGPLALNQVNGNLLVGLPGPSYPTAMVRWASRLPTTHSIRRTEASVPAGCWMRARVRQERRCCCSTTIC